MKQSKFFTVLISLMLGVFGLTGCMVPSGSGTGNSSKTQSVDPVGSYSGKAEVLSMLDLGGGRLEIGVELPDGRITSVKVTHSTDIALGQHVKVVRKKDGAGSVSL